MRRSTRLSAPPLNLAPMIDVLTVLLIFMVLTFVADQSQLEVSREVDLPYTTADSENFPELHLRVQADHLMLANQRFESVEKLLGVVRAQFSGKTKILVSVDQRHPYAEIEKLVSQLTQAGFSEFHFLAEREEGLQ